MGNSGFHMVIVSITLFFLISTNSPVTGQTSEELKSYKVVATGRAEKIVQGLDISDEQRSKAVKNLIANQYISLFEHQAKYERAVNKVENTLKQKEKLSQIKSNRDLEIKKLHEGYLAKLHSQLSAEQVEKVKDGMTYNVVPLTFTNYMLMLPYLSNHHQIKVLEFLKEARELAMDGSSSKEKHAWFGKYKGKITNYLTAEGYNLKDEGSAWAMRRKLDSKEVEILQSSKIIQNLDLTDSVKKEFVRNLIAHQYQRIKALADKRTLQTKLISGKISNKEDADKEAAALWAKYQVLLASQRDSFSNKLLSFVAPGQLETLKNEMTEYGLKNEFEHFQALLPTMNDEHKKQVYEYLAEARDNAMNALTAKERRNWFIKYRGRANNYLSKQGFDLRKATDDLAARVSNNKTEIKID